MEEKYEIQRDTEKKEGGRNKEKYEQVLDNWHDREAAEGKNLRPPMLVCPHTTDYK